MLGFRYSRSRFGILAILAILAVIAAVNNGSRRVDDRRWTVESSTARPRAVEATTLLASLPAHLTPAFEPGLQLVAMVASDIDDDGDLDLVGDDGSLDLLVWINDGTGHLTRRYARQSGGWHEAAQTAKGDVSQTAVSAVVSSTVLLAPGDVRSLALTNNGALKSTYEPPHLNATSARPHSPRAPPLSSVSL